jgi:hypothetical protein
MKKFLYPIVSCLLLLISYPKIHAQEPESEPDNAKVVISMVPQYTFIGGIRLDLDKRIGKTNNYLVFSPQFYSNRNDLFWSFNYEKLTGFGIKVSHRYFMVNKPKPSGIYLQYGATYNFTRLVYKTIDWVDTDFGGTQAQTEEEVEGKDKIHKIGGDLIVGIQISSFEDLIFDFYIGAGYRGSKYIGKRSSDFDSEYIGILNPAYTGILPIGGFRIGVFF